MMSNSPTTGFALLLVTGYIGTVLAAPPTVNDLPRNIYVGNLETQERYLYTLNVTDPDADAFACSHTITYNDSISTNREFVLREDTTTKEWKFYIRAGALPSPDNTKPYINTIECTDSNSGSSGRYNITVRAVHDELLTLPNIAGTANALKIDAISTLKGKTLKTASANSRGGNLVEYSLVSDPSFSPEFFTIDSSNGVIKANRDFKYLDSRYPTVYLTIKAHDTVDSIDVYETQIVQLTNQNTVPRIVNLDPGLADSQLESLALGSVLMTLTTEDPDASTTLTYAFSCVPPDGKNTFTIDTNGNVKLAQALDYETVKTYTCGFNVSDGTATGGPFMYTLTVQDANEAPYFSDTMYYATTSEGAAGSVSFDPSFSCSDQDVTDVSKLTYAFKAANNSNRFAINTAGVMTFKENYDVDKNAMPSSVVLTVFCVDAGGTTGVKKTGSTQVTITIADNNDNTPTFSSTAYTFDVTCNVAGSQIGSLLVTDADSGTNADVSCSGASGSSSSAYYTIGADCNIYLSKSPDFATGTTVTYVATAVDKGAPARTGTSTINVIFSGCTTTTSTTTTTVATTTAYNFFDHSENIALFVMSLLMGLALLGGLLYCCLRMCCGVCGGSGGGMSNMCDCRQYGRQQRRARYPPRQVTPDEPPRKYRPPSPRQPTPPPKIIERQPQYIRTVARPISYGQFPGGGGYMRPQPILPGYFP